MVPAHTSVHLSSRSLSVLVPQSTIKHLPLPALTVFLHYGKLRSMSATSVLSLLNLVQNGSNYILIDRGTSD